MAPVEMRRRTGRNRSRSIPLFLAACAVVTSACTSSKEPDSKTSQPGSPPVSTASTSKTPADPTETAKAAALSAYQAYWTEVPKAFAIPAIEGTDLKRYAAFEALTRAQEGTANLKANGRVMTGQPVVSNSLVTATELEKATPNVTISSCLDVSNWRIVDKKSGKPAPMATSGVSKYVVTGHLERWDGSWKVLKEDLHADQPC
ncbi:hypothetical protein OTB20_33215 [Streptomyces sp. H27-H1]|uniref:hypothetical protein n=1 Tax=Streptomyces sp. H27-H1 TaxID=2996461 RepID=UPI00226F6311|nr:hypothetical protein [Streptomyces sp. H27-H1]MCY0930968.1 hypothetical protein [Streptomyces sp. H27-H1]